MPKPTLFLLTILLSASIANAQAPPATQAASTSVTEVKATLQLNKRMDDKTQPNQPLYTGTFIAGMPFDKPFTLHVNLAAADTDVVGANFKYELQDPGPASLVLPAFAGGGPFPGREFVAKKGFDVHLPGVQANRHYKFIFLFYRKLTKDEKEALRKNLTDAVTAYLGHNDFSQHSIDALFTPAIQHALEVTFHNNNFFDRDFRQQTAAGVAQQILADPTLVAAVYHAMQENTAMFQNLGNTIGEMVTDLSSNDFESLLQHVQENTFRFQDTKSIYDAVLADTGRFKGLSMKLMMPIVQSFGNDVGATRGVFNGTSHFYRGTFIADGTEAVDAEFIDILYRFLIQIRQNLLFINGHGPSAGETLVLTRLLTDLAHYHDQFVQYFEKAKIEINPNYLAHALPDKMLDLYIAENYSIEESTLLDDIATSNSPYISLDAGVGYVWGLYSILTYYGFNIYFVPVDKSIRLRTYDQRPLLRVLKTTSLSIGVITNYFNNGNPSKRYASLLGNGMDIFTGFGNRFTRVFKLNAGVDWSYLNNPNPLSNLRKLNGKFVVTLAVDINIVKGFSKVANAIGLSN
jgi:hypothetical protein